MASSGWGKNKKGYLVNSQGKTARQVRQEKYAAKKAAKASGGGGGGGGGEADDGEIDFAELEKARTSQPKKRGYIKPKLQNKSEMTADEKARTDSLFGKEGRATVKEKTKEMEKARQTKSSKSKSRKEDVPKEGGMLEKTDTGTLKRFYLDEISVTNPKKFNEAKLNEAAELIKKAGVNYDAVVVKETGRDRYEVIGNAFIYEAAKRAGIDRINTIVGNEKAEKSLKANRDDEPDTLITGPKKDKVSKTYGMEFTDVGTQKYTYLDEINVKPQQVDQKKVAEAAKRFKEGERNWEPVVIRETGTDRYEVVGNAHLYEAAKQAGFDRLWTIIAGDETKAHKLGGKSKRKR